MRRQFFIADTIQLDTHPAAHTDIRRTEISLRRGVDQALLVTRRRGYPDRNTSVSMMIAGEHGKDFLASEESGFTVRKLFRGVR